MTDSNTNTTQTLEVTAAEAAVIERVRMTPEERKAEDEARRQTRLASLPNDVRKAQEAQIAKVDAMSADARMIYMAGQRLAIAARALKRDVDAGVDLSAAINAQEGTDAEAIAWLKAQLTAGDKTATSAKE